VDSTGHDLRVTDILSAIEQRGGGQAMLPAWLCAQCLATVPVSGVGVALMTADGPSGISLAEAMLRLRARAYGTGQTVSAVAADVVTRRTFFDDSEFGGTTRQD